jgi:hypothetical protein
MLYGSTMLATDFREYSWQVKALRLVLFFVPKVNPDNEKLYPLVKKWCLEIDDNRLVNREIGLDASGRPLFAAPDQRNLGFWPDTDKTFDKNELDLISVEQFEMLWQQARNI